MFLSFMHSPMMTYFQKQGKPELNLRAAIAFEMTPISDVVIQYSNIYYQGQD